MATLPKKTSEKGTPIIFSLIFLLYLCDGDPGTNVVLLKEKYRY
jgi:hypothetical protein